MLNAEEIAVRLGPSASKVTHNAANHADLRPTRRYDHGGQRLDRSLGYTLADYLTGRS